MLCSVREQTSKRHVREGSVDEMIGGAYEVTDSGPFEGSLRLPLALSSAEPVKLVVPWK
jgi:hypothetical protein